MRFRNLKYNDQMTNEFTQRQLAFEAWRTKQGLSWADISAATGIPYTTLNSFSKKPGVSLTQRTISKLTSAFETNYEDIFGTEDPNLTNVNVQEAPFSQSDQVKIAQLDVRYGMGGGAIFDAEVTPEPMTFSSSWIRQFTKAPPQAIFWASGFGDSMYPTIGDGDLVLVDTTQQIPRIRDQIWAISQYNQGMIKRLRARENGYEILSDNPQVSADFAADESMTVIGRVIAVIRRV
jgi:phage repressor protein C with HTH and peptisase S24 domain